MDVLRLRHGSRRLSILLIVLALVLTGCGANSASEPVAWRLDPTATATAAPPTPANTPASTTTPTVTASATTAPTVPAMAGTSLAQARQPAAQTLSADQLKTLAPDELGQVTVLEYHVITTDPSQEAQFVRTKDDFIADLTWLYDHNFHVITMREFIENRISAPAGTYPVVLTFDDASTPQFSATKDANGNLVIDPDSAVGIMEAFFAAHPDFGHTALFALVPNNCFAFPDESQLPLCQDKLTWLANHGYEIGNHTWTHDDLLDVDNEEFKEQVGKTKLYIDEHVQGPANLSDVLILPFGNYPDKDAHADQRDMLYNGFEYNGQTIQIRAALMVGANPSVSPASSFWDAIWIPRVQAADDVLAYWFDAFAAGSVPLYVSDGNPDTITVPDPLPDYLQNELDPDVIANWGCHLFQYDPATGQIEQSATDTPKKNDNRGDVG